MKVERVIDRLRRETSTQELHRTAQLLGEELPRQRVATLRAFCVESACLNTIPNSYAAGFRDALLSLTRSFIAATEHRREQEELLQFIRARQDAHIILTALYRNVQTPEMIAATTGIGVARIMEAIQILGNLGLIDGEHHANFPQRLTARGRHITELAIE